MRKGRLPDPAETEARQRDPELGRGQERVHPALDPAHEARLPLALLGERLHAGRPDAHHGELRGGEERIQQDECDGESDGEGVGNHPAGDTR